MNNSKIILMNIIILLIIVAAGFTGYYYYNQSTLYLSTKNAQVAGQQMILAAPAAGQITGWKGDTGSNFSSGDVIGTIKGASSVDITMPTDGTIVQTSAFNNEFVAPGTPLAYAYDMNNLWITANINETNLNEVKVGQAVDVYIDAFPNVTLSGTVNQIGLATAGSFSLLPQSNSNANYTKVQQVVPVVIKLNNSQGVRLVPGMSAEVRIHK